MKKLISLVMAAAMVASLVPATAFAASSSEVAATAKIVKAMKKTEGAAAAITGASTPELQLKVSAVDYLVGGTTDVNYELTVSLDNADFSSVTPATLEGFVSVMDENGLEITDATDATTAVRDLLVVTASDISTDEVTFTIAAPASTVAPATIDGRLKKNDIIIVKLDSIMDKMSAGKTATVSVESDGVDADDLVYCTVLDEAITASVKKTVDVAEEEVTTLDSKGIKIESAVSGTILPGQVFNLKLSKGFEFSWVKNDAFVGPATAGTYKFNAAGASGTQINVNDNEVRVEYVGGTAGVATGDFTIDGADIQIEATTAKSGAVATLTVTADDDDLAGTAGASAAATPLSASSSVEVAKVCDYKVNLTVDEDEDVPVIYSGVNVANAGLTDDSDHVSLEVTAKETFPGAWSMRQGFNMNLPEGVYVTAVSVNTADNFYQGGAVPLTSAVAAPLWVAEFADAYQDGDHQNFEFGKRIFDDVNTTLAEDPAELTFELTLVADPTFEGDVVLTLEGGLVDTQSVTIAKFVKPYTVKAEQNDVIIDYRNTEIKTPITITEAEAGLWKKGTVFALGIETGSISFEDDATFEADSDSEMELNNKTTAGGSLRFAVKSESDSPATVTVTDMELFMNRTIPAGGYDLEIDDAFNTFDFNYLAQPIYAATATTVDIADVEDYSRTVKEAFVNVVTSGRDQDNLFTTKVVVPVGEAYLVAGETKVTLDAPAYISAAGYTMLPVRAVSSALGVDTNNVLWSAETKTVTIMFAQRIISMTVGQKTIYVNGSAIPASAAPEIKDGRTFLPLRDLGTALGVTNVSWDSATKTATLN